MKIAVPPTDAAVHRDRQRDVDNLAARLAEPPHRPCRDCHLACACSGSPVCACSCTPACPQAPARLSSDPVKCPIEPRILALVMTLAKSDWFVPCWSCEGHMRPTGGLLRAPQVWFYCRSLASITVLDEAVQSFGDARQLAVRWRIRAVSGLARTESAFSLEPAIDPDQAPVLDRLQADAGILAERLPAALREAAQLHRAELGAALARPS